jgi:hypothetical protein
MPKITSVFNAEYARRTLHALCALAGMLGSCTTYTGDEVAAAAYGYPLDVDYATYASAYDAAYTDAWGYPVPLPVSIAHDAGSQAASDPVSAIRALAMGTEDVCPGHVTVTPQHARTPCGAGDQPGDAQIGVKLTFTGCQLQGRGTLDGNLYVTSAHSASDESCSANTIIHVMYAAEFTNLAYTARSGQKLLIVAMNDTGSYDHALGAPPSTVTSTLQARIQRYAASGLLSSDRSLSGQANYAVSASPLTLTMDATFNMTNAAGSGGSADVQVNALEHQASCCYPTSGNVQVTGEESGTYTFGPSCGQMTKDTQNLTLDAC